jgi:hypothetical protein
MIANASFPALTLAVALAVAAGMMPAPEAAAQDDAVEQPAATEPVTEEQPAAAAEEPATQDQSSTGQPATTEQQSATEAPATAEQEASSEDASAKSDEPPADEPPLVVARPKPVDQPAPRAVRVVQVPRAAVSSTRGIVPKILGSYR